MKIVKLLSLLIVVFLASTNSVYTFELTPELILAEKLKNTKRHKEKAGIYIQLGDLYERSKEYEKAKVYVTSLGETQDTRETVDALNQAAGFLRSQLGSRLTIRRIPQLVFEHDTSVEQGRYLSDLISKAVKAAGNDEG